MAKKKTPQLPQELFVNIDKWGDEPDEFSYMASTTIDGIAGINETVEVGVYQLVKIIKVKSEVVVTVEE